MKAKKETNQYLIARAEEIKRRAGEIVDAFDYGEAIDPDSFKKLKETAALVLANAQNKTEFKKLDRIMSSNLYLLKHSCIIQEETPNYCTT